MKKSNQSRFIFILSLSLCALCFSAFSIRKTESVKQVNIDTGSEIKAPNRSAKPVSKVILQKGVKLNINKNHKISRKEKPQSHSESHDFNLPFDNSEIKVIGSYLTKSKNYLDPKKGRKFYQDSEHDKLVYYNRAISQLQKDYPTSKDNLKSFIRQRVISLLVLQYTKYLDLNSCRSLTKAIVNQYSSSLENSTRINIEFDLASVAQSCSTKYGTLFFNDLDLNQISENLKQQILVHSKSKGAV